MENNVYLIDTHIFIWSMVKSDRLSTKLIKLLSDAENEIFLSIASVWEMIIKKRRKKLRFPKDIESGIKKVGFHLLSVNLNHVLAVDKLPDYHADPFDRLLIAQAITESITLITSDEKIWKYNVPVIKA